MRRGRVRGAAAAVACAMLATVPATARAQHEHHGGTDTAAHRLGARTVRAERAAVALRSGATIVDPRASPAAGGSIADLLRTVPGLELDADGRPRMRGGASVLVLVDGRRVPLSGDALAAYLARMPASALERVEAGTLATARQDADGGAGVVNLVFRDGDARRTGMRSLAGSVADVDQYMGSLSAAGELRERLSWDASYSASGTRPRVVSETARWSAEPLDPVRRTDEASRARATHRLHALAAGAQLAPASATSLALRGTVSSMAGAYRNRTAFVETDTAGLAWPHATRSLMEHAMPSLDLGAVASVGRGRVRFTSEARAGGVNERVRGDFATAAGWRYMTTATTTRGRTHLVRNDLALRLAGVGIDLGQQSRRRATVATHGATHDGTTASRTFGHEADVHAGWVAAQRAAGGMRAEAGLRVESERTRIRHDDAGGARQALRLFPSVNARWTDARRALAYRLAYARRIDRPEAGLLNPFAMGEDDVHAVIGNPALRPERTDQLELGLERRGARTESQLTPFVRWTRDPIRPRRALTPSGRSTTTLENLARTHAAGADASVRALATGGTVVTLAGSVAHVATTGAASRTAGVYATARLVVDLAVTERTTAQLYAFRRSAQAIEQGEILPALTGELSVTRRLAGDRGRVTLRASDPLRGDRVDYRIAGAGFTQESRRRTARPLLSLFASWAVGGAPREDAPVRPEGPARIL